MGHGDSCHLLFEQGSRTGSPQMDSNWKIILIGPESFWTIGICYIKIYLSGFYLKSGWSGIPQWQFFGMARSGWIWAMAAIFRWSRHWLPPISYCLTFSSLRSLLGHVTTQKCSIALIIFPWIHIALCLADHVFYALCLGFLALFYFFSFSQGRFSSLFFYSNFWSYHFYFSFILLFSVFKGGRI